jgi:hypothetical protein
MVDALPDAFADWRCEVVALEVERSFCEKATILHTEYHRPADKPMPGRISRHYADVVALANQPTAKLAVDRHDIRDRVVKWKSQCFGSTWANHDQAQPGAFRLAPHPQRLPALRRDYLAMRDMYLVEPASFDQILQVLSELGRRINAVE